ncbi:MAG: hypothetical protein GXO75_15340 [Calditrichaeota bacterium]|nr:hypothetical protein [Calditrichota bacterium]
MNLKTYQKLKPFFVQINDGYYVGRCGVAGNGKQSMVVLVIPFTERWRAEDLVKQLSKTVEGK